MPWVELFAAFMVCHLAGDFLVQTSFQATYKHGGLSGDPRAFRALASHIFTYTLCFVPALIWIGVERDALIAAGTALLIAVPHMIQDDGRVIALWGRRVKGLEAPPGSSSDSLAYLWVFLDQSFHVLVLFGTALLVAS